MVVVHCCDKVRFGLHQGLIRIQDIKVCSHSQCKLSGHHLEIFFCKGELLFTEGQDLSDGLKIQKGLSHLKTQCSLKQRMRQLRLPSLRHRLTQFSPTPSTFV